MVQSNNFPIQTLTWRTTGTDAANECGRLLDIILAVNYVGTALLEFRNKREKEPPQCAVIDLDVRIEALNCVYDEGRQQTSKVSTVGFIVEDHDWRRKANSDNAKQHAKQRPNLRVSESMWSQE